MENKNKEKSSKGYFILYALSEMTVDNPTAGSFRTYASIYLILKYRVNHKEKAQGLYNRNRE